jgi:hypothetical protein
MICYERFVLSMMRIYVNHLMIANEFKSEEYQNAGQRIDILNLSAAVVVNLN